MNILIKEITAKIARKSNRTEILFVSLCGWADTGKTTLANKICNELNNHNIKSDYISTDSFMIERTERNQKGITGYNTKSLKEDKLTNFINKLKRKETLNYFPYDNKLGKNSTEYRIIKDFNVIIIEGLHSFNEILRNQMGLLIYIDGSIRTLKKLRFEANIKKRGFAETEARLRINNEMDEYTKYILPNKIYANINIEIDDKYNYKIIPLKKN